MERKEHLRKKNPKVFSPNKNRKSSKNVKPKVQIPRITNESPSKAKYQKMPIDLLPLESARKESIDETDQPPSNNHQKAFQRKQKRYSTTILPQSLLLGQIKFSYRLEQNENFREYMEDYIVTKAGFNCSSSNFLFCVFDGHGGKESAELCTKLFPDIFLKRIMARPFDIEGCLTESFLTMNKEIEKQKYDQVGNTATVVYIENYNLYCANVGDSSCAFIEKDNARFISIDDDFYNPNEKKRVEKAGGKIIEDRLEGDLAISRSLGDFDYKNKGLIAEPHICKISLDGNSRYCVLASDGIWTDLSPDDVMNICNENVEPEPSANKIVEKALESGSEDNISCIVIKINKKK